MLKTQRLIPLIPAQSSFRSVYSYYVSERALRPTVVLTTVFTR